MKKAISMLLVMGLSAGLLAGCGAKSVSGSEEATAENPMVLTLSHGLSETHTVHIAMEEFAEKVEERTDGRIKVEIFPNAQLGSETESMEQLTAGVIAMTKVASPILATYEEGYNTFGLPYIFDDTEDFYHVMDSDEMHDFFLSTEDEGFVTLTYYTSGARSFYTKDKAIRTPEDLKGLKIRVQQSPTNVQMMSLLGGSATPMGFGEVYTALQSKVIDGAENNEMALTSNGHGDVCKFYSYDMHQMIPDILVANNHFLEKLSAEDRAVFEEGFDLVNQVEREEWVKAVEEAKKKAENEQKVQFLYPDTKPFQDICMPMHEDFLSGHPDIRPIYEKIQQYNAEYPSAAE